MVRVTTYTPWATVIHPPWVDQAACRDGNPDDWFDPSGEHEPRRRRQTAALAAALAVCASCPVRTECAEHALATREPFGVWGGLTPHQRKERR